MDGWLDVHNQPLRRIWPEFVTDQDRPDWQWAAEPQALAALVVPQVPRDENLARPGRTYNVVPGWPTM